MIEVDSNDLFVKEADPNKYQSHNIANKCWLKYQRSLKESERSASPDPSRISTEGGSQM